MQFILKKYENFEIYTCNYEIFVLLLSYRKGGEQEMQQWNLVTLRKQNKYTQPEIAEMLGISFAAYQNKETGRAQFKADEMFAIAKIFNKPIEDIFLPSNYDNLVVNS